MLCYMGMNDHPSPKFEEALGVSTRDPLPQVEGSKALSRLQQPNIARPQIVPHRWWKFIGMVFAAVVGVSVPHSGCPRTMAMRSSEIPAMVIAAVKQRRSGLIYAGVSSIGRDHSLV